MARIEKRNFLTSEGVVSRSVDLENTEAMMPFGAILVCDNGHEVAKLKNAILESQQVLAEDFEPLQEGLSIKAGDKTPNCMICGGRWIRGGITQINVKDKGWLPGGQF